MRWLTEPHRLDGIIIVVITIGDSRDVITPALCTIDYSLYYYYDANFAWFMCHWKDGIKEILTLKIKIY